MGAIWWYAMSAVQWVACFQNSLICFRRGSLVLMSFSTGSLSLQMSQSESSPTAVTPHSSGSTCGATEHHWGRPAGWQRACQGRWRHEACLPCKRIAAWDFTAADYHSHSSSGMLTSLGHLASLDGSMQQPQLAGLCIKAAAGQQAVGEHGQVVAPASPQRRSVSAYKGLCCIISCRVLEVLLT
jgi:hypothetical protein